MTNRVALVDYGAGNMFSIEHALRSIGGDVVVVSDGAEWGAADPDAVVLPGVGAFGRGMQSLSERGMDTLVKDHSTNGRPLLGICLGAQLLLDGSSEFGDHRGLGIVAGSAVPFDKSAVRVPHIGWGQLRSGRAWDSPLFRDVPEKSWMYFVHSFHLSPSLDDDVLSTTALGPLSFTSSIHRGMTYGVQFHPEKSGPVGLRILRNFLDLGEST